MKLDYFKDCVIGTELKLDLFLERNRGLMYEFTAGVLQRLVDKRAVVLRFKAKPRYIQYIISLELLVEGEYQKREIGLGYPKELGDTVVIEYK